MSKALPAWQALAAHRDKIADHPLKDLFAADPGRSKRMQAEAASTAQSFSGAGIWVLAVVLTLLGAGGVWSNRKLRHADELAAA